MSLRPEGSCPLFGPALETSPPKLAFALWKSKAPREVGSLSLLSLTLADQQDFVQLIQLFQIIQFPGLGENRWFWPIESEIEPVLVTLRSRLPVRLSSSGGLEAKKDIHRAISVHFKAFA